MSITLLNEDTINKIAAGEVIERPSSVVKELVENAIDAGATAITIEIKDGGISFIRITDNGCGIEKPDIPLAFLSHATSKIKSVEDLMNVSSLGFRGEALSSIASVSQIEMITKTQDNIMGYRYCIEGGEEKSFSEVGAPDGTTFIVRNLFFNTPVRRKFLRTAMTEGSYVNSLIEHISLSHPEISFRFINNNQNKIHTSGNLNLKDIIYNIYGRDITENLLPVHAKTQDIEITGFIGKPVINRGNRTYENYFINGRFIKSSIITKAIEEGYKGFIMQHNYPFTALHFNINPSIIDVNVHPTKMELRFSANEFVESFVLDTVREALKSRELISDVHINDNMEPNKESQQIIPDDTLTTSKVDIQSDFLSDNLPEYAPKKERIPEPFETKREETYKEKIYQKPEQISFFEDKENKLIDKENIEYTIIGQLFDTYWLIEYEDRFYMMDQHAAHEKILYEKLMKKINEEGSSDSQMIMPPVIISLNMRESQVLEENSIIFTSVGFEFESFGGREYKITGIPAGLPNMDYKLLFIDILDNLSVDNGANTNTIITERVASMACKAAVKGNNRLNISEAKQLMNDLMKAENPYNCPHGRPTLISMTKYEIEKKFKRIV